MKKGCMKAVGFTPLEKVADFGRLTSLLGTGKNRRMLSMQAVRKKSSLTGFTLLEILVVMAILGILAVIVVPRLAERPKQAKRLKVVLQIKSFQEALELFYVDKDFYPSSEQGLNLLIHFGEGVINKYLDSDKVPLDPWGNPYQYLSPGLEDRSYDIVSFGQDGRRGGDNWDKDVESWNLENEKPV